MFLRFSPMSVGDGLVNLGIGCTSVVQIRASAHLMRKSCHEIR